MFPGMDLRSLKLQDKNLLWLQYGSQHWKDKDIDNSVPCLLFTTNVVAPEVIPHTHIINQGCREREEPVQSTRDWRCEKGQAAAAELLLSYASRLAGLAHTLYPPLGQAALGGPAINIAVSGSL